MRLGCGFRARFALLLAAGLPVGSASAFPKLPAVDRHGDPLPAGAVARLGTVQLRAGCEILSFSADGKTLIGVEGRTVRLWNAADGKLIELRLMNGPEPQERGYSADGRSLVLATEAGVEVWDLPSATRVSTFPIKGSPRIDRLAVSSDRRWIAFTEREAEPKQSPPGLQRLRLRDVVAGTTRNLAPEERDVQCLQFAPDGGRLVSSSPWKGTCAWDTASGRLLWTVPDYIARKALFTPDGEHVITAPGFGHMAWRVWDAHTGRPSKDLRPPSGPVGDMCAALRDGTRLLHTRGIWDLKAGKLVSQFRASPRTAQAVLAPDGRSVVTHDVVLYRWDLATGKNLYADVSDLGHTAPVFRLFFTPDGKNLVSIGVDDTARVWDVSTARPVRAIPLGGPLIYAWSMSPDAATLIGIDAGLTVHRWPVGTGGPPTKIQLRDAQALGAGLTPRDARILPDGTLALLAWSDRPGAGPHWYSFSFWDPLTGRLDRWGGDPGPEYAGKATRLGPDGRMAVGRDVAYDTGTGTHQGFASSPFGIDGTPVFSPDGRLLAASSRGLRVWEAPSGRVLAEVPAGSVDQAAFSPDGRRVVCASRDRLTVWNVSDRTQAADWRLPAPIYPYAQPVTSDLVFSPDGRTVATGHSDGTILLWRVPAPAVEGRWSAGEGAALWEDLGDETPGNAWTAVWQLADHPADAVRLLRGKYPLAPVPAAEDIAKLIAGLDSPKFAEREAASKRLAESGRAAERPLRQALKASPSPEQAKRIETLLAAREPPATRPRGDELRAVRAVAVLEACATAEARRLLSDWADRGPPRLSDEAARALERLKWQPVRP